MLKNKHKRGWEMMRNDEFHSIIEKKYIIDKKQWLSIFPVRNFMKYESLLREK